MCSVYQAAFPLRFIWSLQANPEPPFLLHIFQISFSSVVLSFVLSSLYFLVTLFPSFLVPYWYFFPHLLVPFVFLDSCSFDVLVSSSPCFYFLPPCFLLHLFLVSLFCSLHVSRFCPPYSSKLLSLCYIAPVVTSPLVSHTACVPAPTFLVTFLLVPLFSCLHVP